MTLGVLFAGSLGAFQASITNNTNTAGVGTLAMQEDGKDSSGATATCKSGDTTATCSTINKYGGKLTMIPGEKADTSITITNTGSITPSTFTLAPGTCIQSAVAGAAVTGSASDLCAHVTITVTQDGKTTVYSGPAANFTGARALTVVAPGATSTFAFTTTIDSSIDSNYEGLQISQPLVWTFTA